MSEHQYYEFRAVDRPLDRAAMAALRAITSRAEITPTSLVNEYHWGDFKGNPDRLMEQYFDAHLYTANWGTHRLMLRLPVKLLPLATAEPYTTGDAIRAWATQTHTILDFRSDSEDDDEWVDPESLLASLLPLRAELTAGDLRALYLGWLAALDLPDVDYDEAEAAEDETEPPVPPGLGDLSASLVALAGFLRLDPDLLDVAARASFAGAPSGPSTAELEAWVGGLPDDDKNFALARLLEGDVAAITQDLLARFRTHQEKQKPRGKHAPGPARRTVGELFAARESLADERRRQEAERKAAEVDRRNRENKIARAKRLDSLVGKEEAVWREIEEAIGAKSAKQYDHALALLRDLRDLAARDGTSPAFAARVTALRERHKRKITFVERLDRTDL
ncbi:MAG: hypothetical protein K2V38_01370 [Gemmataceae bacterium]|nr:hypothetical protein [Gemmataceae bacterium]